MRDDVSVTDWSLHTAPVANRVRRSWPRALWELVNARAANHPKNALQSHMSPTTVVRLRRRLSDHFRSGCGRCIDAASVLISGGGGFRRRRPHRRRWLKALSFPHRFSNDFIFSLFFKIHYHLQTCLQIFKIFGWKGIYRIYDGGWVWAKVGEINFNDNGKSSPTPSVYRTEQRAWSNKHTVFRLHKLIHLHHYIGGVIYEKFFVHIFFSDFIRPRKKFCRFSHREHFFLPKWTF